MSSLKQWQEHSGVLCDEANGFELIDCRPCGFRHIIPIPTPEELEEIYREEYYSLEKPLYLERHRQDLEWWNLVYSERYAIFEELLPRDRRRILDVGSGPGYFLLHGKQRGWWTLGVEPSRQAAAHSRALGLEIAEVFLNEATAASLGRFDVVHLSEVLEHIPHPRALLKLVAGLLDPGGLVCVLVPNDYNPLQQVLREACDFDPWWVAPPHHINYFDFPSLQRLFESAGLEVVHSEATFPIDLFLLMGDNYVGNDDLGRTCHGKRMRLEKTLARAGRQDLKRQLYEAFASVGIGREALVVGRRN